LLLLIVLPLPTLHAAPVVSITDPAPQQLPLTHFMEYYRDQTASLSFTKLVTADLPWQTIAADTPAFGYDQAPYWFRFTLHNQSSTPFDGIIEITYPILDHINVFSVPAQQGEPLQLGDTLPFHSRPLNHQNFTIPALLQPGETRQIYLQVTTTSAIQVPTVLWQRDAFFSERQYYLLGQGAYFGILLVMILYNLFVYLTVRHRSYLYYVGAVSGMSLFMITLHGFGLQYLWPNLPQLNQWFLMSSLGIFGIFGLAFTISLLQLQTTSPRFYRVLVVQMGLYTAFLLPIELSPRFYVVPLTLSAGVCALSAGAYTLCRGLREARYYILAYSSLLLAGLLFVLNKGNIIPRNFFTENALQMGSVAEVILLSFALADRINLERQQKFQAQRRALENEKLAREERERYLEIQYQSKVEELHSQQKLLAVEAESKAKSEFLATMSHEIRTPMNGVLGMAELLQDTDLTPQQQQYVSVIDNSGKSLLNIINDVLDYSKISAGKMELETITINLENLCQECASMFMATAERKGLQFQVTISPEVPALIAGDPTRLRQVLLNLLGNAFKFTRQGHVKLQVDITTEDQSEPQLRFQIIDSGIGIAEELRHHLFQAFVQADSSTTRQFGGTGLGLSISQRLVELMHGRISMTSTEAEGSCFEFRIPLLKPVDSAHQGTAELQWPPPAARIADTRLNDQPRLEQVLVVEDNHINRMVLSRMLEKLGIQFQLAHNGEQALQQLRQDYDRFDAVLMDCEMPVMDGYEATRRIRQLEQELGYAHKPVVAISAHILDQHQTQARAAGMDEFICKPLSFEVLTTTLAKVLRAPQLQQPSRPLQN